MWLQISNCKWIRSYLFRWNSLAKREDVLLNNALKKFSWDNFQYINGDWFMKDNGDGGIIIYQPFTFTPKFLTITSKNQKLNANRLWMII